MMFGVEKLPTLCRSSEILQAAASPETLLRAWKGVRRRRPHTAGEDGVTRQEFGEHLVEEVEFVAEGMLGGTHQFKRYVLLRQSKYGEEPRPVYCPTCRDGLFTESLAITLSEMHVERLLSDACYAYRRKRGPWRAVQALWMRVGPATPWLVVMDLRRFFYSMSVDWCVERTLQATEDPAVGLYLWLRWTSGAMDGGVFVPSEGVAPGDPVAGLFANWYLSDEDREIASFLSAYLRYSDDLAGLAESRSHAEDAVSRIRGIVGQRGLTVKDSSVQIVDLRHEVGEYLGWAVTIDDLAVSEARLLRLRSRLEWIRDAYLWRPDVGRRKSIALVRGALNYYAAARNLKRVFDLAHETAGWFPGGEWREILDGSVRRRRGTGRRRSPATVACPAKRDGGRGTGGRVSGVAAAVARPEAGGSGGPGPADVVH